MLTIKASRPHDFKSFNKTYNIIALRLYNCFSFKYAKIKFTFSSTLVYCEVDMNSFILANVNINVE